MQKKKKPEAYCYTFGKFGKGFRETLDTDGGTIYECGRRKTKFKKDDFGEDYCYVQSRSLWYMVGYVKATDVVDLVYSPTMNNHLLKDDYLYISYKEPIEVVKDHGFKDYRGFDVCFCGFCIVDLVKRIERYNPNLKSLIRKIKVQINKKARWYYTNHPTQFDPMPKNIEKFNLFDNKQWPL